LRRFSGPCSPLKGGRSEERTGVTYYTARIGLPEPEIARLGALRLLPGMPVETFVRTGERTVLSYLMKPFSDQAVRAFRAR
jgi:HlyD family secretion protein